MFHVEETAFSTEAAMDAMGQKPLHFALLFLEHPSDFIRIDRHEPCSTISCSLSSQFATFLYFSACLQVVAYSFLVEFYSWAGIRGHATGAVFNRPELIAFIFGFQPVLPNFSGFLCAEIMENSYLMPICSSISSAGLIMDSSVLLPITTPTLGI
jgi:hypothetical protein